MLFKNGLNQSSRWNLDDFDGDDPNVTVETKCTVPSYVASVLEAAPSVVVLHNKLAACLAGTPQTRVGDIEVDLTAKVKPAAYKGLEGYDEQYDEPGETDSHRLLKEVPVYTVKSRVVLVLPTLDIEVCGTFAKELVKHTSKVQVWTPGQGYGEPLTAVYSSASSAKNWPQLASVPVATPPTLVQGATAAILSAAERTQKSAVAIVVYADGTAGHEAMLPSHQAQARDLLFEELGLERAPAPREISALYL